MTAFSLTSYSTTARTLTGGEFGVLVGPNAILDVNSIAVTTTGFNTLVVNGTIINRSAGSGNAVQSTGIGLDLIVGPTGVIQSTQNLGILGALSGWFNLSNAGTIMANNYTMSVVASDGGAPMSVVNTGQILATYLNMALESGSSPLTINNSGTIMSNFDVAIQANTLPSATGQVKIINTGTISGGTVAYQTYNGNSQERFLNSGTVVGDVFLGNQADRYEGSGSGVVIGLVSGGNGQDTLVGGDLADTFSGGDDADLLVGRAGDDLLGGGVGNDTLYGGAGDDSLDGGTENDVLNGGSGDDTVLGGPGNDVLVGQDGVDSLDGGDGNDTIDGGSGDDALEGGADADILRGQDGADVLAGGLGSDLLSGGPGDDSFVFRSAAETAVGASRDQILDFEKGVDTIIVAGLSPGVFEFRGTAAFAPSGNPELRLFETPSASTIVQLDVDGDGIADAEIRVANVTGLTAEDFVL